MTKLKKLFIIIILFTIIFTGFYKQDVKAVNRMYMTKEIGSKTAITKATINNTYYIVIPIDNELVAGSNFYASFEESSGGFCTSYPYTSIMSYYDNESQKLFLPFTFSNNPEIGQYSLYVNSTLANGQKLYWDSISIELIDEPIIISSQPIDKIINNADIATFSVYTSQGSHISYQWYYSSSVNGKGTIIPGATSTYYQDLTASYCNIIGDASNNGKYYYCIMKNSRGTVESKRAKLTVYSAPTVSGQSSQNVKVGDTAKFSVSASGGNPSTKTYQWYYSTSSSGSEIKINGATSSSYNLVTDLSQNGRYYFCKVSNGQYTITSSKAKLTVSKKDIANTTINVENVSYTGKELKPIVIVKYGNTVLKNGTDYTLSYSNNINIGTGKVIITGKGNYSGTITKSFNITSKSILNAVI